MRTRPSGPSRRATSPTTGVPPAACVVSAAKLPPTLEAPLARISPTEALEGLVPDAPIVLVDTRDMPGQLRAFIARLTAAEFHGLVILLTPFVHVPVWLQSRHRMAGSSEGHRQARAVEYAMRELVPAYLDRTGRPFIVPPFPDLMGVSPSVERIRALLPKVAAHDRGTVLIRGESGTGKQVVARGIHDYSSRRGKPFVEVNCTALPDTLLESELFGRERGAYTDAHTARRGLIETAGDGTLFLDEIGHMTEKLQMALLKVIEQRTFRRVGGNDEKTSNARFLAATSRDLKSAMEEGAFRGDLYYRLNVLTVGLPNLRERDADALLLAHHFARQYASDYDRPVAGMTGQAALMLLEHQWPGNVREVRNIIERAVVFHDDEWLNAGALALEGGPPDRGHPNAGETSALHVDPSGAIRVTIPPWGISLDAVERAVVQAALQATSYNITKTAKLLFISRDTLRYRIKKYGFSPPRGG